MTIHVSTQGRNAQLDALLAQCESGRVQLWSGTQPTNANAPGPADGGALATLQLNGPAFAEAASGTADLIVDPPISGTADADGVITWARVVSMYGDVVMDGSVGTGSGSDFVMNSTYVTEGQVLNLLGGSISLPA